MIRKFINWLLSLRKSFKSKKISSAKIPQLIDEKERLSRAIFSPINIDSKGKLKSNAFRTPADKDEISVNRLEFASVNFCKAEAKKNENASMNRSYFGFAIITQNEIQNCDCTTVYTPIEINPYHCDIKIGYIPKKGEELPSKFRKKVDDMTKVARFYNDPNPSSTNWLGDKLE